MPAQTTLATLPDPAGVFTGANLAAINTALTAQNANNGTISAAARVDTIALSNADLLALHATPKVLVAAQGAGTLILFNSLVLEYVYAAAFTIGSATNLTVAYKADASGGAASTTFAVTGFLDQTANKVEQIKTVTTNIAQAGNLNQPLVLSLAGADVTGGAGTTGIAIISYTVVSGLV
jgi:hypothetical protein